MVLVDTSVWIDHFKKADVQLRELLLDEKVVTHPFVMGELACGNLKNRVEIFSLLKALPQSRVVEHDEVLQFIENKRLMGRGIGLVDMHLLASTVLTKVRLWTADKRLRAISTRLDLLYK